MESGGEAVKAVFVSELFSTGTIGRDAHRRFWGGALGAFPHAGRRRLLRRQCAVAIHTTATGRQGRRAF